MLLLNALNIILPIAALLVGLAVGYFITSTLLKKAVTKEETALLEEAKEKAEVIKKERILQAKEKFLQMKDEHEKACDERKRELASAENRINQLKQDANKKMEEAQRKSKELQAAQQKLEGQLDTFNKKKADLDRIYDEEAKKLIDVGNFADYMAAEIYIHNGDWPNNNVRAWRSPEQPWKFMVYDLDHGFGWQWGVEDPNSEKFNDGTNMFTWIKQGGGKHLCKETGCFANLYIQLIKNPDFKRLFINRSCAMWKGYLNGNNVSKVVDQMVNTIPSSEKDRDLEKFKQNEMYYPGGFDWKGDRLKEWARSRDGEVVSLYKGEFFKDDGDAKLVSVKIKADGDGSVLMEGMHLPGTSSPTNYSGEFFNGMQMELTAVPTNGAVFKSWSGCEAVEGKPETCRATITDGLTITASFK